MLVSLLCVTILTAMLGLASSQMSSLNCDSVPPSLWCSSQEMAKTCGFDALCNKYLEANQEKALQKLFGGCVLHPRVQRFGKLVKTELLPFGNADLENGNVVCSHGSLECQVDSLEVCAINYLDEPFHFVYCLEKKMGVKNSFKKALKKCFRNLAIPLETARKISECSQSEIGAELRKKTMDRIKEMNQKAMDMFLGWHLMVSAWKVLST
uniref:Uncharacterized protein n=1 Tax=Ditylenchus dipsaci TaxID=166011 RepID=A0A915EU27_9BILA